MGNPEKTGQGVEKINKFYSLIKTKISHEFVPKDFVI
jgi:hypothetical protein